jgi:hypothetical protein
MTSGAKDDAEKDGSWTSLVKTPDENAAAYFGASATADAKTAKAALKLRG